MWYKTEPEVRRFEHGIVSPAVKLNANKETNIRYVHDQPGRYKTYMLCAKAAVLGVVSNQRSKRRGGAIKRSV